MQILGAALPGALYQNHMSEAQDALVERCFAIFRRVCHPYSWNRDVEILYQIFESIQWEFAVQHSNLNLRVVCLEREIRILLDLPLGAALVATRAGGRVVGSHQKYIKVVEGSIFAFLRNW